MYTFEVVDLGTDLNPFGINDSGSIVGIQRGTSTGFVWKNGQAKSLPPLPGDTNSFAFDINAAGRAVGDSSAPFSRTACVWSAQGNPAPLERTGSSGARCINDLGDVGGEFNGGPVIWKNGVRTHMPTTGYSLPTSAGNPACGNVSCINSGSAAVGWNGGILTGKPVAWPATGGVTPLTAPGSNYGPALSINDALMAVGEQVVKPPTTVWPTPWLWTLLGAGPLPLPPPAIRGTANAINNNGLVVGTLWHDNLYDHHAYSWFGPVVTLLDNLIDPTVGWKLFTAQAVNNRGEVVGIGSLDGSGPRGYLLRRIIKPRHIKVPPETWHMIYGVHGDGPGWVLTEKGPIRVPPWTPYIQTLPREIRPMIELLLDVNQPAKRSRATGR